MEAIILNRLDVESEIGVGDDTRINLLIKEFFKWVNDEDNNELLLEKIVWQLIQAQNSHRKSVSRTKITIVDLKYYKDLEKCYDVKIKYLNYIINKLKEEVDSSKGKVNDDPFVCKYLHNLNYNKLHTLSICNKITNCVNELKRSLHYLEDDFSTNFGESENLGEN